MTEERQPTQDPRPQADESERPAHAGTPQPVEDALRRGVFIAAARLLAYPDRALWTLLPDIEAYLPQLPASDPARALAVAVGRLRETDLADLEARYVATFDFSEATSLYLTAHELGDSRRRGQALVELRALLRAAGFEEATEELPDYLPPLLEFLAHAPADTPADALERRLSAVCERIHSHLEAEHPYLDIFVALRGVLPAPAESNPEQRFPQRERADTGEMPFPLRYD